MTIKRARAMRLAKKQPGPDTITALVVELTRSGKSPEAIAAAVAKKFPRTAFAKQARAGTFQKALSFYQSYGRMCG